MDDTIYDEIDYYESGFRAIAKKIADDFKMKDKDIFEILWSIFNNQTRKNVFNILAEKVGLSFDEEYINLLVQTFRNHKPAISLPPESREVLKQLKRHYKLGLITDGWLPGQQYKVKALNIEPFFDLIIYTEELGTENWKPSPKAFEMLIKDLNVKAAECVYVADNLEKDFIAPNAMGFKTIRIVRERRIHFGQACDQTAKPGYELSAISDLPDLLRKIDAI